MIVLATCVVTVVLQLLQVVLPELQIGPPAPISGEEIGKQATLAATLPIEKGSV